MATWAIHQDKVLAVAALSTARQAQLYPYLDEVNTSFLALADGSPDIPADWPGIDAVRGLPRGYIKQRILRHEVGGSTAHNPFYRENVMPALEREGARLMVSRCKRQEFAIYSTSPVGSDGGQCRIQTKA